jgi:hypothetical protein
VPEDLVSWVENVIAARRGERGGSWYALTCFDQAVMTLVWLAKDATYEQLAADFAVGVGTAHQYVNDTIDQLARFAPPCPTRLSPPAPSVGCCWTARWPRPGAAPRRPPRSMPTLCTTASITITAWSYRP